MIQREFPVSQYGLITLTAVELSADYAHARVGFTILGAAPEPAEQALNDRSGYLHSLLYRALHIHTVPRLRFYFDRAAAEGLELSQLISQAAAISAASPADEASGGADSNSAANPLDSSDRRS